MYTQNLVGRDRSGCRGAAWLVPAGDEDTPEGRAPEGALSEGVRWERVERIRREIAAGTYDSDDKWEAALDRLADRLGLGDA